MVLKQNFFFFPFLRPLWIEFPDELETFGVEDEYMLGKLFLTNCSYDEYRNYVFLIIFSSVRALKKKKPTLKKAKNKNKRNSVTKIFRVSQLYSVVM